MDPFTLIQTTWEVVRNFILEFTPNDQVPAHPNTQGHSAGNATATLAPSLYYYNPDLIDHPHHSERQRLKVMKKLRELAKHDISIFKHIPPETLAKLFLLGLFFVPATSSAVSLGFTVMALGPIAEAATIEILANAAFMQAATRAGAVVAATKGLELNSIFSIKNLPEFLTHAELSFLKHFKPKQLVRQAVFKGVETPRDSVILWTALGRDGVYVSEDFARANGGITLEMTPGGKWLNELNLFAKNSPYSPREAMEIWEEVSVEMMKRASGQVRSIRGKVMRPDAIYKSELEIVDTSEKITGIDEMIVAPRIVLNGI